MVVVSFSPGFSFVWGSFLVVFLRIGKMVVGFFLVAALVVMLASMQVISMVLLWFVIAALVVNKKAAFKIR